MVSYRDKKIFVFRNYTIEALFLKYSAIQFSSYDGIDENLDNNELYIWFYLCPIKNDPELIVNEIGNIYTKLELTLNTLQEKKTSLLIFTVYINDRIFITL